MSDRLTIVLRSLVRHVGRAQTSQLRDSATQYGCVLQRIRRSRDWQIEGTPHQLHQFCQYCQSLPQDTHQFIIQRVHGALAKLPTQPAADPSDVLQQLVRENRAITLAELMAHTDCTMREARAARDAVDDEWL
ncbi:MAG: ribosome recycling factor family protein [Vibrio sp.]